MIMIASKKEKAYALMCNFIEAINEADLDRLEREFGVGKDVYEEIVEGLSGYYETMPRWTAPPIDIALRNENGKPMNYEFFEMNTPGVWGIECRLWCNGSRAEPILRAEFREVDGNGKLDFQCVEN
jgi:hypothetical protein